jgi:hypothetical protein
MGMNLGVIFFVISYPKRGRAEVGWRAVHISEAIQYRMMDG